MAMQNKGERRRDENYKKYRKYSMGRFALRKSTFIILKINAKLKQLPRNIIVSTGTMIVQYILLSIEASTTFSLILRTWTCHDIIDHCVTYT